MLSCKLPGIRVVFYVMHAMSYLPAHHQDPQKLTRKPANPT